MKHEIISKNYYYSIVKYLTDSRNGSEWFEIKINMKTRYIFYYTFAQTVLYINKVYFLKIFVVFLNKITHNPTPY